MTDHSHVKSTDRCHDHSLSQVFTSCVFILFIHGNFKVFEAKQAGSRCKSFLNVKSITYEHGMNWSGKNPRCSMYCTFTIFYLHLGDFVRANVGLKKQHHGSSGIYMCISIWFLSEVIHFHSLRHMVTSHPFEGSRTSRRRLRSGEGCCALGIFHALT